ncbi:AMP-dependent synthetase ligase domain containing protein [Aphelenchoides besseyi]|nr:AMP-dependent synthetase ligase domain containing protein [Aphelenchoides besseyi]
MDNHVNFTDYFLAFIRRLDAKAVAAQTVDFDELAITFGEIPVKVATFEKLLKNVGLKGGSRVVIVGANSTNYLLLALAVLRCQCVFIPINPGYKTNELREYLERAQASVLLVDSRLKSRFEVPVDNNTPIGFFNENEIVLTETLLEHTVAQNTESAIMFFSSGTTGYPKLAVHTHKSLCAHLDVTAASRLSQVMPKLTSEDVCLSILPFFHAGGLLTAFVMLSVGVRLIVWDRMVHEHLAEVIQRYNVTLLSIVPALFNLIVHFPVKTWVNMKLIFVGGDQLNYELRDQIRGWQVSPIELERAIEKQFPVILASCVFEENGKLFGVVQLKPEDKIDTEQILNFIRENFVRYKHLDQIYATIQELDRTLSGKLCRWKIQSRFSNNFNAKST